MEPKRKSAYRQLLYHFLLDIRTAPTDNRRDSWSDDQREQYIRYAGAVAYLLHNLALASADDFVGFDELAFWDAFVSFERRNLALSIDHLKTMFDRYLTDPA